MAEPMNNVPAWQFNTLPGNANQGAILMTRNDITLPPFNQDNFIWKAMEDVIGVADMKLEYDEENNLYSLYKAKGHQDNEDEWTYDYELVGTFHELTEAVEEALENMEYISYSFDTTTEPGKLIIKGVKKDGTEVELAKVATGEAIYSDSPIEIYRDASNNLKVKINYDTNQFETTNNALHIKDEFTIGKMTYKGEVQDSSVLPDNAKKGDVYGIINEADMYVNISNTSTPSWKSFTEVYESFNTYAIELIKDTNGMYGKLRYDNIDFMIDAFHNLKSMIIDDTLGEADTNANRHTYSIVKIMQLLTSVFRYKGQVSTYNNLPTTGQQTGDCWNVIDTGDNYAWNGTGWDKLSGDYIAGAGISISGKVISATGISFIVGNGLEATGSGSTTTLKTKNGNGISYDTYGAITVQKGSGVTVNSNGVNVNTGTTTKTENDNIEVNYNTTNLKKDANGKLDTVLQTWTGTQAQYDAITTKDPNTLYMIHE